LPRLKDKFKTSVDIPLDLWERIEAVADNSPVKYRNHHMILLMQDGLDLRDKVKRLEREKTLLNLKTVFFLRHLITAGRGEDVLKEMDRLFKEELPNLEEMILGKGIDYEGL